MLELELLVLASYIRAGSGHNESTSIVSGVVDLTTTSKIGFDIEGLGNTGTVVVPAAQSSMRIVRMKD